MSRIRTLLSLLMIAAFVLAGCGNGGDKFVGSYTGKQELSKAGQDLDKKRGMTPEMIKTMSQMQFGLNLNKDKTATLNLGSAAAGSQPMNVSGTWEFKDNKIVITLGQSGQQAAVPMELTPGEDGKSLIAGSSQFGNLVFTKN